MVLIKSQTLSGIYEGKMDWTKDYNKLSAGEIVGVVESKVEVNAKITFILENNKKRDNACKKKYYLDTEKIKDRNIILVDDSLVRGTTMKNLIQIFRESGAKSIHVRIAAPPIKEPCYFGVDIPTKEELIANQSHSNEVDIISKDVSNLIGADSLYYLRFDSIEKIMTKDFKNLCTGCFNGNYNEKLEW